MVVGPGVGLRGNEKGKGLIRKFYFIRIVVYVIQSETCLPTSPWARMRARARERERETDRDRQRQRQRERERERLRQRERDTERDAT